MKIRHTPLKSLTAGLCLGAAALAPDAHGQASTDALVDQLLKKGVLTESEAKALRAAPAKPASAEANEVRLFWRDGLALETRDKKTFTGRLGGRIDLDIAGFDEDGDLDPVIGDDSQAGVEFRRARISLEGQIGTALPALYKLEMDFAGDSRAVDRDLRGTREGIVAFKDVYLGLTGLPAVGTFQLGHFKEPIGLDILTSSRFTPFMERAAPLEAFAPERNTGAMFQNAVLDQRMTWALGAFTDTGDSANSLAFAGNYRISGRVTAVPWFVEEEKGRQLLHVGISGSRAEAPNGEWRFRSRPEAHLAPRYVDTGTFDAHHFWMGGLEAALVFGPFSVQGEYLRTWVDRPGEEVSFDGLYAFASWFITGEHRPYRRANGTFDRVKPNHNFGLGENGGAGAWEVLLRYSQLDLNDEDIAGGRLNDITGGVNWYLNPNWKIMFNYVFAHLDREGVEGNSHIFETRFHVDF
jgi:phosphate-selective porin OprO/OprP